MSVSAQDTSFDLNDALSSAQPGEVIHVPAGVYPGPLVIDKPVTLIGEKWPVIQGTGKGDVITVEAPDVTIQGFVIRGSGDKLDRENAGITGLAPRMTVENNRLEDTLFGIYIKEAPNSVIRGNVVHSKDLPVPRRGDGIRAWYSEGVVIEDNHVKGSRDVVIWFSPDGVVRRNLVEDGRYGLHFMFSDNQLVEENILQNNSVGAFLMYGVGLTLRDNVLYNNHGPSGYGVGLKDVDNIVATGNRLVGNRVGTYVDNSPREPNSTVEFEGNLFAYNEIGAMLQPLTQRNSYTENIFQENGEQISVVGKGQLVANQWSVEGRGNYWSDYAGFDADNDGIGDLPYRTVSLFEDLTDIHPGLRLFYLGPATDALDLAARAFPIFQPQPKMADDHPLMTPPVLPEVAGLPTTPVAQDMAVALALLLLGLAIVILARRRQSFRP